MVLDCVRHVHADVTLYAIKTRKLCGCCGVRCWLNTVRRSPGASERFAYDENFRPEDAKEMTNSEKHLSWQKNRRKMVCLVVCARSSHVAL